jgi:hypothetical protein
MLLYGLKINMKCLYPFKKVRIRKGNRLLYEHRCGQCMPCRITRKQELTLRIMLEAKCHVHNSYVTLTYSNQTTINPSGEEIYLYRNKNRSLDKQVIQKFLKRLRKNSKKKFRYYCVGEYGDVSASYSPDGIGREHYHLILFGYPAFFDEDIQKSWFQGYADVQPLDSSRGGCGYVAGYTTKKLTKNEEMPDGKMPEFALWSRGSKKDGLGGIGAPYVNKIVENMTRDKLNFVGDDFNNIRISGMLLPVDSYLKSKIDKKLGYTKIDKSLSNDILISMKSYKNMAYPEAEEDAKAKAEIKARQRTKRYNRSKKI